MLDILDPIIVIREGWFAKGNLIRIQGQSTCRGNPIYHSSNPFRYWWLFELSDIGNPESW